MRPVKLGIIGTGIAARKLHWPALKQLADKFEIVQVCNHTEPKAKQFSELIGGVPYTLDYRELLANPEVEAVNIILPIHLNYIVTRAALEAGKHVIVEKPLAANLADAEKMLAFPDRYPDLVMMVAENFRYRPLILRLKELLNAGTIGEPYAVFWNNLFLVDDSVEYVHTRWRIDHQYPGGFVTDGGVHQIAAIRELFGDIVTGQAQVKSINPAIGEVDTFNFQFTTAKGVQGVLNLYYSAPGLNENRLVIIGDQASISVEQNHIVVKDNDTVLIDEGVNPDMGYVGEFEDFFAAIREGRQPVSTFSEAFKDLQTIISALEKAEKE